MTKIILFTITLTFTVNTYIFAQNSQSPADKAREFPTEKSKPTEALLLPNKIHETSNEDATINLELNADAAVDIAALDKYKAGVGELLNQERFDKLEEIAAEARSNKSRFSGGVWKLYCFYQGLSMPHTQPHNWAEHLNKLQRWKLQQPDSITARVALAAAYESFGYEARGEGLSDSVTEDGWKLFAERVAAAKTILEEASTLKAKCPHWYYVMLTIMRDEGADRAEEASTFKKAMAFEPLYYYNYRMHAIFLLPKWFGEDGETERFADDTSRQLGGKDGSIIYFEIASEMVHQCNCDIELEHMSWMKIQQGHAAMEEKYGVSLVKLNQFARMAVSMSDAAVARKTFEQIGNNWDGDTWRAKVYFDHAREWASQFQRVRALN